MDMAKALLALADYAKPDPTFAPIKDQGTTRWHATVQGREFELLLTGSKFWDTRSEIGGGGAVDLSMHLFRSDFKTAIGTLRKKGL
ncbi:hypothetical protein [Azonexus sp. R2A61]|uniref:hypothetical protein n=1 Tax=Azonexus sp. R2A61 TaxID=2744443 RepID=UPI001F1E0A07|nr:hypothetical protein [Azonexus sp. R2A61]